MAGETPSPVVPPKESAPNMPDISSADIKGGDGASQMGDMKGENSPVKTFVDALEKNKAANEANADPKAAEDTLQDLADGKVDAGTNTAESSEPATPDVTQEPVSDIADANEPGQIDAATAALNRNGILTEEQRQAKNAQIDADRAATDPKGEKRYFNGLRTKASNTWTRHLDNKATRLNAKAEAATAKANARRPETATPANEASEPQDTPPVEANATQPTAPEAPSSNAEAVPTPPAEVDTPDTEAAKPQDAEAPEAGNAENKADKEQNPEEKNRAEKMQLIEGAQKLASMGIDINSEGGKKMLELMVDNPQFAAEFNKATAGAEANVDMVGPEGAAAAADVMADTLDDQITKAEEAGDKKEVQRLGFLRGLLKALAVALAVVAVNSAKYAANVSGGIANEAVKTPK